MYGRTGNRLFVKCRRLSVIISACLLFAFLWHSISAGIPDTIYVERGKDPTPGRFVTLRDALEKERATAAAITVNGSASEETLHMQCLLLGVIPIKDVTVHIVDASNVIPGGVPIGIYVRTKGVLVVDTAQLNGREGEAAPSRYILKAGDYIVAVDHMEIMHKEELVQKVQSSGGDSLLLSIIRDGEAMDVSVDPVEVGDEDYRIGAWVRDDMAGVGTLTYVMADGSFGALGHSISDADTDSVVELEEGTAYSVEIIDVIPGEKGSPGELVGQIQYEESNVIGSIDKNTSNGIFGTLQKLPSSLMEKETVPIGYKQDVVTGSAQILVGLGEDSQSYEIEIEHMDMNPSEKNKGLRIRITDEALIEQTGGIIQGLSGAPIIQHGRLIGSVTHVFVSDPLEGYGIFIEDMMGENVNLTEG